MNIIIDLKKNTAALPHRISLSQNVPSAPDVKRRRPTGLTRAEVRKVVEQMIG
jgi:hypothetical protein